MIPPKLRTAAARFALGMAQVTELVEAAHDALDRGIYADGLGLIATARGAGMHDLDPLFRSALAELRSPLPTPADAFRHLQLVHLRPILEGAVPAAEGLERYYRECHQPLAWSRGSALDSWDDACSCQLAGHSEELEGFDYYHAAEARAGATAKWETDAVELARKWCAEYGRAGVRPAWTSVTVMALATGIDTAGAFDRLPILADALEEAGCDDLGVLDHCRDGSPHRAVCWVVNLLLSK